jgi:hypothetical protein
MWRLRQLSLVIALALAASVASARPFRPGDSCRRWTDHPGTRQHLTAAFLYRLAHFVEWPAADSARPFVIGILDDDKVAAALERMVAAKAIDGRPFEVRRLTSPAEIVRCRIAFLAPADLCLLPHLLDRAMQAHVLTVSGMPDFARHGGVIDLVPDGCDLRFEINREAALCSGLQVSSKLLALATLVDEGHR